MICCGGRELHLITGCHRVGAVSGRVVGQNGALWQYNDKVQSARIASRQIIQMTNKIVQEHPEQGTREFALVDDAIEYRINSPFADEELSVVFSVLNPEPVVDGEMLYFISEVNREALIKLFVDLPDVQTFASFVSTVQRRIREEGFGKLNADNRKTEITEDQGH